MTSNSPFFELADDPVGRGCVDEFAEVGERCESACQVIERDQIFFVDLRESVEESGAEVATDADEKLLRDQLANGDAMIACQTPASLANNPKFFSTS